jgi:xanthine dehydrogenase/oxidase
MSGESHNLLFYLNGKQISLLSKNIDPRTTLLQYIRYSGLTGTKLGCGEGGCGACTVMLSKYDAESSRISHISVNACLTPLCSVDGCAITTVEGIGGMRQGLHPVQKRVATMHGSQCGFCTPGIVMAIYTKLRCHPNASPHEIEESLDGNLCRCTGYRPILDAARSLSNNKATEDTSNGVSSSGANASDGSGGCCRGGSGECPCRQSNYAIDDSENIHERHIHNSTEDILQKSQSIEEEMLSRNLTEPIFPPFLMRYQRNYLEFIENDVKWYQPIVFDTLLSLKNTYPQAKIVVGNTEIGIETKFKNMEYPVLINPTYIPELQVLTFNTNDGLIIGSGVTINRLRDFIHTLVSESSETDLFRYRGYQAMYDMTSWFASNHIRNVACIGGNIVTASPISDLNPMLMACQAVLKVTSLLTGSRYINITEFFLGYRKVNMKFDEILEHIMIPAITNPLEYILPFKQARRREDDISIVTSGIRICLTLNTALSVETEINGSDYPNNYLIEDCALSFGGMSVTTILAKKTMSALIGQSWAHTTIVNRAYPVMKDELALPETVPGGKAEYRTTLALSFLLKAFLQINQQLLHTATTTSPPPPPPTTIVTNLPTISNFITSEKPWTRGEQSYSIRLKGLQQALPIPHTPIIINDHERTSSRTIVGQSKMHVNAEAQVTGDAQYTSDKPLPSNAVYIALVLSTRAHARIVKIDSQVAETMPGFIGFFTAQDVLGSNHFGPIVKDEEIFTENIVKYYGAVSSIHTINTMSSPTISNLSSDYYSFLSVDHWCSSRRYL